MSIKVFLPAHANRPNPTNVAKKFTIPIRAVTVVADISSPLNTMFE
jgi:hypothetical protein